MTPIDDLNEGDYIAVCNSNNATGEYNPDFVGEPFLIMAIDLPWIAVIDQWQHRMTIDVRTWQVQRVTEKFVAAMTYPKDQEPPEGMSRGARSRNGRIRKKAKRDKTVCSSCGSKLIQKVLEGKTKAGLIVRAWRMYCEECDSDKGPVAS